MSDVPTTLVATIDLLPRCDIVLSGLTEPYLDALAKLRAIPSVAQAEVLQHPGTAVPYELHCRITRAANQSKMYVLHDIKIAFGVTQ